MSRQLTSDPIVIGQELFSSSATPTHTIGEKATDGLGRKFRYVKAGLSALVTGNVLQAPAQVALHQNLVVPTQAGVIDKYGMAGTATAAPAGSYAIKVTLGATLATAQQYAGGWLLVDTAGTGSAIGYMYPIAGHPAAASAAALTLELALPIQSTIVPAQNTVSLIANPYSAVIQSPVTTLTGAVVGVATYPIAASEYGWIQTGGPAGVLVAGTPGVGLAVVVPGTAAGCVVIDGAASATVPVGAMMATGVDGKSGPVLLTID